MTGAIPRRHVDGILLLDKPLGLSSNAALQRVKRLYRADKAGHTGTLDPLASGLLPICFGEATKFANLLLDADKTYLATLRLGVTTSTADAEGDVLEERPVTVSRDDVQAILPRFRGRIAQVPPRFSALKRDGRNYYDYARRGVEITREAREVEVHELELMTWRVPEVGLAVRCAKGTYIRALAEDVGRALGCGAHLSALRRIAAGEFEVAASTTLEALETRTESERDATLLPVDALVRRLARVDLDGSEARRLTFGQALVCPDRPDGTVRVYAVDTFVGVADVRGGIMRARRMRAQADAPDDASAVARRDGGTRLNPKHFSG